MSETINNITVKSPEIRYESFLADLTQAKQVAAVISEIELTEDNVKDVKKTLADSNKLKAAIETRRKEIKKEIMKPYDAFAEQVKQVIAPIEEADSILRGKVREMEEKERDEKQLILQQLWDLRLMHYSFGRYVPDAFSLWLEPRHLNKSTTVRSAEDEMVDFMEDIEKDVSAILSMPDSEDIMIEYAGTLNLADALEAVRQQREYREKAFETQDDTADETATFVVTGKANITLTEKLLEENGINYRRIK